MALWTIHDKPKFLNATEKAATFASGKGWVRQNADGTQEVMVAISRLSSKQVPGIRSVKTNKTSYNLKTDASIIFTVNYSHPITNTLTSATKLAFSIGAVPLEADFTSASGQDLVFTYDVPGTAGGRDAVLAVDATVAVLGLTDITLNGAEKITLDNANYVGGSAIQASLVLPYSSIAVTVTRPAPDA
jgi:hypothetical protein